MVKQPDEPVVPVVPAARGRSSLRAFDADRERVAELVRSAVDGRLDMSELDERLGAVFAARTYDDLAATVTDLAGAVAALPLSGATAAGSLAPRGVRRLDRRVLRQRTPGSLGGPGEVRRGGRHGFGGTRPPPRRLRRPGGRHHGLAMFGSVEIQVPEGVTVRADGIGVLASFESAPDTDAGIGAPVLVVRGAGVFGSIGVKRPRPGRGALRRAVRAALDGSPGDDPDRQLEVDGDRARLRDGRDPDREPPRDRW